MFNEFETQNSPVIDLYANASYTFSEYISQVRSNTPKGKHLSAYILENGEKTYIRYINYLGDGLLSLQTPNQVFVLIHVTSLRVGFEYQDNDAENPTPLVDFSDVSENNEN